MDDRQIFTLIKIIRTPFIILVTLFPYAKTILACIGYYSDFGVFYICFGFVVFVLNLIYKIRYSKINKEKGVKSFLLNVLYIIDYLFICLSLFLFGFVLFTYIMLSAFHFSN